MNIESITLKQWTQARNHAKKIYFERRSERQWKSSEYWRGYYNALNFVLTALQLPDELGSETPISRSRVVEK